METIEEFAKFRTVRNDNGLLGLEYRDEMIVPCQYYEITRMDDYFLCRKTGFEQYVDFDGEVYCTEESPSEKEEEEELNDGFIQTWARGKYGVLTPLRKTILPPVYDEVYKWQDCDVIYTRQGAVAKYFNTDGNQILCNVRNIVDAEDELEPYYEGEPQTNVIQLMDLSDEPVGDDFCRCHGRRAGLSRRLCPEHFEYLRGILTKNELNIIFQLDQSANIQHTNRNECSWNGYHDLYKGFMTFLLSKPISSRKSGNFKDNLDRAIHEWNRETDLNGYENLGKNPLKEYIERKKLTILPQYMKYCEQE